MTWSGFYLFCFAVGFAFSMLSFLLGGLHWHLAAGHPAGALGGHGGPAVLPHVGQGMPGAAGPRAARSSGFSRFNLLALAAFLAWFGGIGYLLTRYSTVWLAYALLIAVGSGLAGATVVSLFLTRVLISDDENLDPADFEMRGMLGCISSPIREGGTGEIIYSQGGTRRACSARSDDDQAIPEGTEVVVTRYDGGVAYVRRWSELANDDPAVG